MSWCCRLNALLRSDLVDDFVAALELLSSPELIFKVLEYLRERERERERERDVQNFHCSLLGNTFN